MFALVKTKSLKPISFICQHVLGGNLYNHGILCVKSCPDRSQLWVCRVHRPREHPCGPRGWIGWAFPKGPWSNTAKSGETEVKISADKMGLAWGQRASKVNSGKRVVIRTCKFRKRQSKALWELNQPEQFKTKALDDKVGQNIPHPPFLVTILPV